MSLLQMAEEITRYIVEELGDHIKLILVYGSLARGEATEFSDLDIVVITDGTSYNGLSSYRNGHLRYGQ